MCLLAAVGVLLCGCQQQKYPCGRDTKDSFGNGRFQVLRTPMGLVLCDNERSMPGVVYDVKDWKKISPHVFLVDDAGKCWKVNYESGEIKAYEDMEAADQSDRKVFHELLGIQ